MAPRKNSVSVSANDAAAAAASHVKRPMNAFMLYRQNMSPLFSKDGVTNHEISSLVGQQWQTLSDDEKAPYFLLAEMKKQEHKDLYPNYKYTPNKKDATNTNVPNAKRVPKMKKAAKVKVTNARKTSLPKVETFFEAPLINTTMSIFNDPFALEPLSVFLTEEVLNGCYSYEDRSCDLSSPVDTSDGLFFCYSQPQPQQLEVVLVTEVEKVVVMPVAETTFQNVDFFNLCNEDFMNVDFC